MFRKTQPRGRARGRRPRRRCAGLTGVCPSADRQLHPRHPEPQVLVRQRLRSRGRPGHDRHARLESERGRRRCLAAAHRPICACRAPLADALAARARITTPSATRLTQHRTNTATGNGRPLNQFFVNRTGPQISLQSVDHVHVDLERDNGGGWGVVDTITLFP